MAMAKIKKGDTVVVLTGKDKGRTGEVTKVSPKDSKVIVSGVNVRVRHTKPTQADPQGGKKPFEAPVHISNVAIADKNGKASRVRIETGKDGSKSRIAVKTGEKIDG
jgi:large subunit ribosomal protein L24